MDVRDGTETAADGHACRVLLIEDNEDAVLVMKAFLELSGHEVDVAYDGSDGIDRALRGRPDVVLCDIGLPGDADGYRVARTLRGTDGFDATFLIALTGFADEEDAAKARSAGFDLHLTKPVDPSALIDLIADGRNAETS